MNIFKKNFLSMIWAILLSGFSAFMMIFALGSVAWLLMLVPFLMGAIAVYLIVSLQLDVSRLFLKRFYLAVIDLICCAASFFLMDNFLPAFDAIIFIVPVILVFINIKCTFYMTCDRYERMVILLSDPLVFYVSFLFIIFAAIPLLGV